MASVKDFSGRQRQVITKYHMVLVLFGGSVRVVCDYVILIPPAVVSYVHRIRGKEDL